MSITLYYAAPDADTFAADLEDFCAAAGFPSLLLEDGSIPNSIETGSTRIDTIQEPISVKVGEDDNGDPIWEPRGWHIDVKLSEANPAQPTGRYQVVAAAISQWFSPLTEVDYDIPDDVRERYQPDPIKVKKTERGCTMLPTPAHPKRGWS